MYSSRRYLVFDIETIWDRTLLAQALSVPEGASFEELKQHVLNRYTSGFPPPPFHIPICIALIDVDAETSMVSNAAVLENASEAALLQQFWKVVRFRKGKPVRSTLVHFNGRGFDLPVLLYRSMKHRVPVVTFDDRSRFSFEFSHDICDDLSEFGATNRISLDVLAKMLGLPGKTETHGGMVEDLYEKGERARIRDYCMSDALATYHVWLNLRFVRGQITEEKYQAACNSAEEVIRESRARTDSFFTAGN